MADFMYDESQNQPDPAGGVPPRPGEGGTPPPDGGEASSVTRHPEITDQGDNGFKIIHSGIDTLELGYYVSWGASWELTYRKLDSMRERAKNSRGVFGGITEKVIALVFPSGKAPSYRFHLQIPEGHVFISHAAQAERYPTVLVSLSAEAILQAGLPALYARVDKFIAELGGHYKKRVISRVDMYTDVEIPGGITLENLKEHSVRCGQKTKSVENTEGLETFYVGVGKTPIMLRIYDKQLEVKGTSKEQLMLKVYQREDLKNIWRVEYQIRRKALKHFRINSVEELQLLGGGLWSYLTEKWATFRDNDDSNTTRRTIQAWWKQVQEQAAVFGPAMQLKRNYKTECPASIELRYSYVGGHLIGIAAFEKVTSLREAIDLLHKGLSGTKYETQFAQLVEIQKLKHGLAFDPEAEGQAEHE